LTEAVGQAELLSVSRPSASDPEPGQPGPAGVTGHDRAAFLDLAPLLHVPELPAGAARHRTTRQDSGLDLALDNSLIQLAEGALAEGRAVRLDLPVRNVNRAVGTMLGYEVTRRWGGEGLPDGTIVVGLRGSAGQSLGAFLPRGITIALAGDANDYVGKGLSGGRIIVAPDPAAVFAAAEQVIAGNVIGYGATSGELFLRGVVGERFCVRNSGATAVAEGVGDHGCEYMTGGRVLVLGPVGRNFAAGMSGGVAYLLDPDPGQVNLEMVDLEPVSAADLSFLADLLGRYQEQTGSTVAAGLLDDWDAAAPRLCRVMPKDYQRALAATRRAEREGGDVAAAVMAAARA
jgi:glutamate synthase (NADPH/NADH) large chain